MSFIWSNPQPSRESEEDSLSAAVHAAFASLGGSNTHNYHSSHTDHPHHDMRHKSVKHDPTLEIQVNSDALCLRGAGVDVEPALLSGNVILNLHEPTSLKQIVLQFRGKARIPASATESISIQSNHISYLVCNHEWTFLEGPKGHSHTLKAGRHLFPFQLHLGGSLPSSISTTALGGASVHYKLRATAIRSGFFAHRDITATCPIYVLRGLINEALEYQQTLEIENTWPEKIMYSIMLPHKAWAAGEKITAAVKFSPLVKGARVLNVTTTVNETVKLYGRSGCQEAVRVVASAKHDIVDGKAVLYEEHHPRYRIPLISGTPSVPSSPRNSLPSGLATPSSYFPPQLPSGRSSRDLTSITANSSVTNVPITETSSLSSSRPGTSHGPSPQFTSPASPAASTSALTSNQPVASTSTGGQGPRIVNGIELPPEIELEPSADVITTLQVSIPEHATPSHGLEPIQVSHRIRWSILIGNRDGHTSELRCSLPLLILDNRLIEEAKVATLATRRLLLGPEFVEGGTAVGRDGETVENEDDMELPSYSSHVRDRVANAYLPEQSLMRVINPWVTQGVSPVLPGSGGSSGMSSPLPLEAYPLGAHPEERSQLPQVPPPDSQQLQWVNSEILLSLTQNPAEPPPPLSPHPQSLPPEPVTSPTTYTSRFPSRLHSHANSRGSSPERRARAGSATTNGHHHNHHHHHPDENHSCGDTYVHSSSTASRHLHGLFSMSMKPFGGLSSFGLGSRSNSRTDLQSHFAPNGRSSLSTANGTATTQNGSSESERHRRSGSGSASPSPSSSGLVSPSSSTMHIPPLSTTARPITADPVTGPILLHRAFTETPDYEVASRGFLGGGVPPLESLRGLPSYEEAAASAAALAAAAAAGALPRSRSVPNIAGQGQRLGRMSTMSGRSFGSPSALSVTGAQQPPPVPPMQTAPASPRASSGTGVHPPPP